MVNFARMNMLENVAVYACEPWSLMPILCIVLSIPTYIGMVFLVKYLLKKDKEIFLNLILFALGLTLLGLEIYHQVGRYIQFGFYDFTSIPWQVCSIPIYVCLFMPWLKKGLVKDSFIYFTGLFYIVAGTFPLLFGQAQLCRWETIFEVFRSFLWHIIIVHIAIICLSMRPIGKDIKTQWKPLVGALVIFLGCNIIAQIINVTCHYAGGVNYPLPEGFEFKNSEYAKTHQFDPDTTSCFYISPYFQSNMPVYSLIWEKCGWVFNWFIYYTSFSLLSVGIYFAFFGVKKLIANCKNKKANVQPEQ